METFVWEWLNLAFRWVHVIAGIMWIGDSLLFTWMDRTLLRPETHKAGVEGELWMVHSGGFYLLEKNVSPGKIPSVLHWFKWEAGTTWLTGFALLTIVYYFGGILVDPTTSTLTNSQAVLVSLGILIFGWAIYDMSWKLPLPKPATMALLLALLVATLWKLSAVFTGRALFLQTGALFGTIMVANVWMRIIPAQRHLVAALATGDTPAPERAARAKFRSKHNTYFTYPVVFVMFSNHFPTTYGHESNWLVLLLFIVLGAGARHLQLSAKDRAWCFPVTAASLGALLWLTFPRG